MIQAADQRSCPLYDVPNDIKLLCKISDRYGDFRSYITLDGTFLRFMYLYIFTYIYIINIYSLLFFCVCVRELNKNWGKIVMWVYIVY